MREDFGDEAADPPSPPASLGGARGSAPLPPAGESVGGVGGVASEPASEDEGSVDAGIRCASWIETG